MMADELKPCPFCGELPKYSERQAEDLCSHDIVTWKTVTCINCDVRQSIPDDYEGGSAVDRWNNRPIEDAKDQRIKELEEALQDVMDWSPITALIEAIPDQYHPKYQDELKELRSTADKAIAALEKKGKE